MQLQGQEEVNIGQIEFIFEAHIQRKIIGSNVHTEFSDISEYKN